MYNGKKALLSGCRLALVLLIAPNEDGLWTTGIMVRLELWLELEITIEGMLNGFSIVDFRGLGTGFLT